MNRFGETDTSLYCFLNWDENSRGGQRMFEGSINKPYTQGADEYSCTATKDGDTKTLPRERLFDLGTGATIGDKVIAYYDDRAEAFVGEVMEYNSLKNKFFVKFQDGDTAWVVSSRIHKYMELAIGYYFELQEPDSVEME